MNFKLIRKDSLARAGEFETAHGSVRTPCFMPVGTQATVKTLSNEELKACGTELLMANAYHLYLRPGKEILKKAGGLHKFMAWDGPIITDSGGYQIFSLAVLRKVKKEGVEFKSHIDGSTHFITPESIVEFQQVLGSDIMMPLDVCLHYPVKRSDVEDSLKITLGWAKQSKKEKVFGIIQGNTYLDLRKRAVEEIVSLDFDGYAIGGVAVGEPSELIHEVAEYTAGLLPENKVRYLMGVGTPLDMLDAISEGMDLFDCVVPTRNGRNGQAFTWSGELQLRNAPYKEDFAPIDDKCGCFTCRNHSRSYIRHLFNTVELLGLRLVSLHNIYFYVTLMGSARSAIIENRFSKFKEEFERNYKRR